MTEDGTLEPDDIVPGRYLDRNSRMEIVVLKVDLKNVEYEVRHHEDYGRLTKPIDTFAAGVEPMPEESPLKAVSSLPTHSARNDI